VEEFEGSRPGIRKGYSETSFVLLSLRPVRKVSSRKTMSLRGRRRGQEELSAREEYYSPNTEGCKSLLFGGSVTKMVVKYLIWACNVVKRG
jgi:hypothetical protein